MQRSSATHAPVSTPALIATNSNNIEIPCFPPANTKPTWGPHWCKAGAESEGENVESCVKPLHFTTYRIIIFFEICRYFVEPDSTHRANYTSISCHISSSRRGPRPS